MSRDKTVERPKAAATDHDTQVVAKMGLAMAAHLADAGGDISAMLTVTTMLAIDTALAAGIDGPAYAKTFEQMWKDRMRLQPQQRLVLDLMALPASGPADPSGPSGPQNGPGSRSNGAH